MLSEANREGQKQVKVREGERERNTVHRDGQELVNIVIVKERREREGEKRVREKREST